LLGSSKEHQAKKINLVGQSADEKARMWCTAKWGEGSNMSKLSTKPFLKFFAFSKIPN
jgi:hypothetical protein